MKKTITVNELLLTDKEAAIQWSDSSESFISLEHLRKCCPCAFCSGEKDVLGNVYKGPEKKLSGTAFLVRNWERVGHYAIRIFWGDGHADGLYTYEMLQKMSNR